MSNMPVYDGLLHSGPASKPTPNTGILACTAAWYPPKNQELTSRMAWTWSCWISFLTAVAAPAGEDASSAMTYVILWPFTPPAALTSPSRALTPFSVPGVKPDADEPVID